MELILSEQCESLKGRISSTCGYAVQKRKNRYFGVRCNNTLVPPNGHWRFIVVCAEIAKNKLHITDIKVNWMELQSALYEASHFIASEQVRRNYSEKAKADYDARDIINLKTLFGL